MCGLVAFLAHSELPSPETTQRALDSIEHRGPDATGEWRERNVCLGHRRLSIIDLETGQQPMHSRDGRYVTVFNGEIYNYRELRAELQREGAVFGTQSDTEVILEGYRRWGKGIVNRLNGMFAFVVWDRTRQVAFVARDRLGIKPLCWALGDGGLIVSSTLEPFGVIGSFGRLDPIAVRDLMSFDYIPAPRTIRQGVCKLEPGSGFEWRPGDGEPQVERYWSPPPADGDLLAPNERELEQLLDRSVARQMVSDVPLGVFLSGGIDSALVVALMARHSSKPIKTYTVAFADQRYDESAVARRVAQEFGTDHTVLAGEEFGAAAVRDLIGSLDEPFCDTALVPLYSLSHLTRQHVKVVLCGDGADEVFGGYQKYLSHAAADDDRMPFSSVVQASLKRLPWRPRGGGLLYAQTLTASERLRFAYSRYGDFPVFRKDLRQLFAPAFQAEACVGEFFEPWERHAEADQPCDVDLLMRTDLRTYLSENCLVKTDRASMLASLEVRVPFLDELLLDRILPLRADEKIVNGQLKALLQPLARRLLPREVWDRPKHGFNVPIEAGLGGKWAPAVEQALTWGERHLHIFNYRYLRRLQRMSRQQRQVGQELWNPVVLLTWAMSQPAPLLY